jgi:hypothetical protein
MFATSGELLSELKQVKQLALESTGVFSGQSEEVEFNLSSLNIHLSYIAIRSSDQEIIKALHKFGDVVKTLS